MLVNRLLHTSLQRNGKTVSQKHFKGFTVFISSIFQMYKANRLYLISWFYVLLFTHESIDGPHIICSCLLLYKVHKLICLDESNSNHLSSTTLTSYLLPLGQYKSK